MKNSTTKRALLLSVLSLMLCISMLIGTTYAWFTDSVTTGVNSITSGTLSVDIQNAAGESLENDVLSFRDANNNANILWEPGASFKLDSFKVVNTGNLTLKYKIEIDAFTGDVALLNVIDFVVVKADGTTVPMEDYFENTKDTTLAPKGQTGSESEMIQIVGTMDKEAGNEYQNKILNSVQLTVLATQMTSEYDSFGYTYDADAAYAGQGVASRPAAGSSESWIPVEIRDETEAKVASAEVPVAAMADDAEKVVIEVDESDYEGNFIVATGLETKVYDVTVEGLKDGNTEELKMNLRIEPGLDPDTVKLYHYDDEIDCDYDPVTGYVSFWSATFSPFTIVFDAESEYVAPTTGAVPTATVVEKTEWVGKTDIPWGSYGAWSPTEGLTSTPDAAYTFSCNQTPEEAAASKYAYWECDFFVKLDRDLGPNQIFLGGYYSQFNAHVGFHNGEFTLPANTEIPMIGSVAGAWTYAAIARDVGVFDCCVADVDDALKGATFTVTLRLTNPDNRAEIIDVQTVSYTFE